MSVLHYGFQATALHALSEYFLSVRADFVNGLFSCVRAVHECCSVPLLMWNEQPPQSCDQRKVFSRSGLIVLQGPRRGRLCSRACACMHVRYIRKLNNSSVRTVSPMS